MTALGQAAWLPRGGPLRAGAMEAAALPEIWRYLSGPGRDALATPRRAAIEQAWNETIESLCDPAGRARAEIENRLAEVTGLSPANLDASLAALLRGFSPAASREVFAAAAETAPQGAWLTVLAANIPGLALQPLLVALATRRPLLLKLSSREPIFTQALLTTLADRLPQLGEGVAAVAWPGGDPAWESFLARHTAEVAVYGDATTIDDVRRRFRGRVLAFGPKASIAIVSGSRSGDLATIARGLARDVALFDQRGCLSLQTIFTDGETTELLTAMGHALAEAARELPAGPVPAEVLAAVAQVRQEASLLGLAQAPLRPREGTVIVDPRAGFVPSPGMRTVRIVPLREIDRVLPLLEPAGPHLQGAALAGERAQALAPRLAALGISYLCSPGELQSPPAGWKNGGLDLVAEIGHTDGSVGEDAIQRGLGARPGVAL